MMGRGQVGWRAAGAAMFSGVGLGLVGVSVVGFAGAPLARAQADGPGGPVSTSYRVVVGDVIGIAVLGHPEFSIATTRVQTDGAVAYFYGPIAVLGRTTEEIGKAVATVLTEKKQLAKPVVVVSLVAREVREANVYGPVRSPGKVVLRDGARVLDVLASAGGLASDRIEFVTLNVYRADGTSRAVDLGKLYSGNAEQNFTVVPGDNFVLQEKDPAQIAVRVVGEVKTPTTLQYPKDGSVVALLNAAGGPGPGAALSKAVILRAGKSIEVDLRSYLVDGRVPENARLEPGDTLVIPVNRNFFRVNGVANRTGDLPYPDDRKLTLKDALSTAGIPPQGANLRKVRVIQADTTGKETVTVVNAEKLLTGEEGVADIVLKPGDSIYVPSTQVRRPFSLQDVTFGVSSLVGLSRIFGILR